MSPASRAPIAGSGAAARLVSAAPAGPDQRSTGLPATISTTALSIVAGKWAWVQHAERSSASSPAARSAAVVAGYETYIITNPLSVHSAISSASAIPSQRWTRNVMRRAQRVARVKREKRGAARDAGKRPAPVLEAEVVGGMDRERGTTRASRIRRAV